MNDNIFNALAHEQRRTLLLDLLESNPQDVRVNSSTGASALTDVEKHPHIMMYHTHLPKLEDYGHIEWDRPANKVFKGPQFGEIQPLLEWLDDHREHSNHP
jgi:hypothetical protein